MGKLREDRDAAIAYARQCIETHGIDAGERMARQRYPDVDRGTWWRWMKTIRADAIGRAAVAIAHAIEVTPAEFLPAAPSPAVIARQPASGRAALDFMGKLGKLYDDGEKMRDFAVTVMPDGTEKIRMAGTFGQSIRIRSDLLERWTQASQMLFDWEQMTGFYDLIVREITLIDPETGKRIMERLAELNRDMGFNAAVQT